MRFAIKSMRRHTLPLLKRACLRNESAECSRRKKYSGIEASISMVAQMQAFYHICAETGIRIRGEWRSNALLLPDDGSAFIVACDVSTMGEGALAWDRAQNRWVRYDGATWDTFGGLAGVTGGVGIDVVGSDIIFDLSDLTDLGAAAEVDDYVAITDVSSGEASRKVTVANLVANVTLDGGTY